MKLETVGFLLAAVAFVLLNIDAVPNNRVLGFVCFFVACGVFMVARFRGGGNRRDAD